MFIIKKRIGGILPIYIIYFADKINCNKLFYKYFQCKQANINNKHIKEQQTLHIELQKDYTESINKQCLYDIRRAIKEEIECKASDNIDEFVTFHNRFLIETNRSGNDITKSSLIDLGNHFSIRGAYSSTGELLALHSYIIDHDSKRVRLFHSLSNIHKEGITGEEKNQIGRANKALHFKDMEFFKELGFRIYDFGGLAINPTNPTLIGINRFKLSFGGTLVTEYH